MHFSCRSFIGRASSLDWSQYWENEPDNPAIIHRRGHLFGLINLHSISTSDLPALGRQIIDAINQKYFSLDSDNLAHDLSQSLSSLPLPSTVTANIALAVVCHQRVHLAISGAADIILRRHPTISHLLSSSVNQSLLSGPAIDNDTFFLATTPFLTQFGLEAINTALSLPQLEDTEENLISSLYAHDNQNGLAAALIRLHADDTDTSSIPDISSPPAPPPPAIVPSPPRRLFPNFLKKLIPPRPTYVTPLQGREYHRRRRLRTVVAVVLLIGLAVSSYLGYRRNQQHRLELSYQQLKSDLDQKLADATAVKTLNLDNSLNLARQAQDLFTQLQALNLHFSELSSYPDRLNSLLSQTGSADTSPAQVFYDTSLITDNPQFSQILISDSRLYLLDSASGRVDLVNLSGKSTQKFSQTSSLQGALAFAENQKNIYILRSDGLYLATSESLSQVVNFTNSNPVLHPIDFAFWNSSLYLLDPDNTAIWKLAPSSSGFSSPTTWLKSVKDFPSNSASLAINGNVWLLTATGQISSYLRGLPQDFSVSSVYQATTANHLVTTSDGKYLAFIADGNYVYLYQKTGEVQARYNFADKKVLDLALSSDSTAIYLLCSDQKIYQITL